MSKLKFRSAFNTNFGNRGDIMFTEPSRTKQAPASEVDINAIMDRALQTGSIPTQIDGSFYGDVSNVDDYEQSLQYLDAVHDTFFEMPAKLRREFNDNPAEFLAFVDSCKSEAELNARGIHLTSEMPADSLAASAGVEQPQGASEPVSEGDGNSST